MFSKDESFQRSREAYFGDYFLSCEATKEINTKITLEVSAETVRKEWTYIILFLTRHNESINDSLSFHFAGDVTIDCWWRYNDQAIVMRSPE